MKRDERMDKYNFDEIYEVLTNFVDYTKKCKYDIPDLLYYLKFKLDIDCLEDFNNIGVEDLDDIFVSNSSNDNDISEEEYYKIVFSEVSDEDQIVLNKLEKVINKYLKTGVIPDLYIESEKKCKTKKLSNNKSY